MERGKETAGRSVKIHRRLSSVFVPQLPPLMQRTATAVSSAVSPVSTKLGLRTATLSNERTVVPNCLSAAGVHRYQLTNYRKYSGNKIGTAKYSLLTFIPKNLWEQFHRIANVYFVVIAGLNWIPVLQVFNRYVGMIPVCLILFLTACKDAYEDFRRRRLDKQINSSYCHVWDREKNRFRKMQWQHVIVGDFVHLSSDEVIPADIVVIRSSDANGICFVETSNLDGETSLKQRRVPSSVSFSGEHHEFKPPDFKATIVCEKPNNLVHQMKGRIVYEDGIVEGIFPDNMLLRGCKIRNTTFVEGIALYTGKETKAMMNNSGVRYKRSSLELLTNRFILYCVGILIAMCLFAGVSSALWLSSFSAYGPDIPFILYHSSSVVLEGVISFVSAILNYQILIPLALYISVEMIKLGQIYLITNDVDLYDGKSDRRMECRSLNIPEELGQVQYVLSDKTGTLTENQMIFRRCTIQGIDYGTDTDTTPPANELSVENVITNPTLKRQVDMEWNTNQELLDFFITMAICNTVVVNKVPRVDNIDLGFVEDGALNTANSTFFYSLHDPHYPTYSAATHPPSESHESSGVGEEPETVCESTQDASQSTSWDPFAPNSKPLTRTSSTSMSRSSTISKRLQLFHSDLVLIRNRLLNLQRKRRGKQEEKTDQPCPLYEAESPDELALVYASRAYGISLRSRSPRVVTVSLPYGNEEAFEVLRVLPFDSTRKRMSIVVRREEEIVVYCKGADSEVLSVLSRRFLDSYYGQSVVRNSRLQLEKFSTQGLRTLCFAKRTLCLNEYEQWSARHAEIENDISDPNREEALAKSTNELERGFILLGVTAIEDRLQEGVEQTIDALREAGVQVWLLTGDKKETAINVARSCGLFPSACFVFVIDNDIDVQSAFARVFETPIDAPYCVVLSTASLTLLAQRNKMLLNIIRSSLSVLCYRMTPSNKAEVVKVVKKCLKGKVLAIGDGANDVSMIQCADVGVGISGQEGMQAVMASDFAIARFRFLHKLLLVHGHWCYDRLANTFLYFLYKNAMYVFVIFWCQIFNGFSGETPMDDIFMMTYPIIFTGAQPLVIGIYDQVAESVVLYSKPALYSVGRRGKLYRDSHFWLNIVDAVWQSVIIYFAAHLTYWDTSTGYHTFGFLLASSIFMINTVHLIIETRCWTLPKAVVFLFFTGVFYTYFCLEDILVSPSWQFKGPPVDVAFHSLTSPKYWASFFLTTVVALTPRFLGRVIMNTIRPSSVFSECLSSRKGCAECIPLRVYT